MSGRVEGAQTLYLISEILYAAGKVVGRTVNIDDTSAPGELSRNGGFILIVVIYRHQFFQQDFRRQSHSRLEGHQGISGDVGQGSRTEKSIDTADDDVKLVPERGVEYPGAAAFRSGVEHFASPGGREKQYAARVSAAQFKQLTTLFPDVFGAGGVGESCHAGGLSDVSRVQKKRSKCLFLHVSITFFLTFLRWKKEIFQFFLQIHQKTG